MKNTPLVNKIIGFSVGLLIGIAAWNISILNTLNTINNSIHSCWKHTEVQLKKNQNQLNILIAKLRLETPLYSPYLASIKKQQRHLMTAETLSEKIRAYNLISAPYNDLKEVLNKEPLSLNIQKSLVALQNTEMALSTEIVQLNSSSALYNQRLALFPNSLFLRLYKKRAIPLLKLGLITPDTIKASPLNKTIKEPT